MTSPMGAPDILVLRQVAQELLRAGRFSDALQAYQSLVARAPDLAQAWYNLGYLQQQLGQFNPALASFDRAILAGIEGAEEAHLNKAAILADHARRPAEARQELQKALALNARYLPALINLARLEEQFGDREAARDAYERALSVDSSNAMALGRLPGVCKVTSVDDPLIGRLKAALADCRYRPPERAEIAFGLGKALDELGAFDDAFAVYVAANKASRESAGEGFVAYDAQSQETAVLGLPALFTDGPMLPEAEASSGAPDLIFICGMFRSGTTLVEAILGAHPGVTAGGELDLLPQIARHLMPLAAAGRLQEADLANARAWYLNTARQMFPGATVLTDKRPDNFLNIGLIRRLFPRAKIIHTQRDPLDNCLSIYFAHLDPSQAYALDLGDAAHWYGACQRLMNAWRRQSATDILDIRYEDLVGEPRSQIDRMLRFLGLEWSDQCLEFHHPQYAVATPSAWQVRQPLYAASCGRWRNYRAHLQPLAAVFGPLP